MATKRKKPWKPDFQYAADYNDHFETPEIAYRDIVPVLDWLSKVPKKDHRIYDPYYCDGRTKIIFQQLGYNNIIHEKRDFYKDIQDNELPKFQTLVTNPPYSDQHKERCLEFAFVQLREHDKPFFLLMPNYVAAKEYYRRISGDEGVVFLSPSEPYEYSHPEGTGKAIPPFASLWFCGLGEDRAKRLGEEWNQLKWDGNRPLPRLANSIEELKQRGLIPSQKRPNPRQRGAKKKRQKLKEQHNSGSISKESEDGNDSRCKSIQYNNSAPGQQQHPMKKAKSKYRDSTGQRKKKRF